VQFNYHGRVQIGASTAPPVPSPAGLVTQVAAGQCPAVWVEPLSQPAGFRALLPNYGPGGAMYVTAIRSEIHYSTPATSSGEGGAGR
jgi:hypothetical protein